MKKIRNLFIIGLVTVTAVTFVSCGKTQTKVRELNNSDFEVASESFITFADLPPSCLDVSALEMYRDCGMNTCIITEDNTNFTQDGVITDTYKQGIENISSTGMDVWIRNMYNDPDYFVNDTEGSGSNYGTPYTKKIRNITNEFNSIDGITGFYMGDEPFMTVNEAPIDQYGQYSSMDKYGKLVDWRNEYYPDSYWHMNMVPSSSYDHYPTTYYDFISYYVNNIVAKVNGNKKTVSLDNYPYTISSGDTLAASYLSDLLIGANITRDYNSNVLDNEKANYGTCIQLHNSTEVNLNPIDTTEKITLQLYTAMACGVTVFEYFCYRSLDSMQGVMDATCSIKNNYNELKEANDKALGFAKVLKSFTWMGLNTYSANVGTSENKDAFENASSYTLKDMGVLSNVANNTDVIIGRFIKVMNDGYNQNGYMLVNYSNPQNAVYNTTTMTFDGCSNVLIYKEGVGTKQELVNGKLRVTLKPGEGVFIIPA